MGSFVYYSEASKDVKGVVWASIEDDSTSISFKRDLMVLSKQNSINHFEFEYFQQAMQHFEESKLQLTVFENRPLHSRYAVCGKNFSMSPSIDIIDALLPALNILIGHSKTYEDIFVDICRYGKFSVKASESVTCNFPYDGSHRETDVELMKRVMCMYCEEYFEKVTRDLLEEAKSLGLEDNSRIAPRYKPKCVEQLERLLKEESKDILITDSMDMFLVDRGNSHEV